MPRFRRNLRPIKSDKHEITWSNLVQDASSSVDITLVKGVQSADKDTSIECEVGSHVKSIYIEFNVAAQVITNPKVLHWQVEFVPTPGTQPLKSPALYYQVDRSQILKRGMEMLPKDVGTVYKRIIVVRIPKKAERIAEAGFIMFRYIASSSEAINMCGFAIYKEYY